MTGASRILANLALLVGSVLVIVLALLLAELVVRTMTDVGRLGTERALFVNQAWGESIGNAPNTTATAFGVEVHTDESGFRSSTAGTRHPAIKRRVLVLGDSVAFGAGVPFDKIATTRIEKALTETSVINSSVIGYNVNDYLNVTKLLVDRYEPPIDQIILVFCLNDVSEVSAAIIRKTVSQRQVPQPVFMAAGWSIDENTVRALRDNATVKRINDSLRAYSSLYVLVRGVLIDPRRQHWQRLQANYSDLSRSELNEVLAPLARIAVIAAERNVPFRVWIVPYAEQMHGTERRAPQDMVTSFLREQNIEHVDLLSDFLAVENSSSLFLPYDPVHLSELGHELLAVAILKTRR